VLDAIAQYWPVAVINWAGCNRLPDWLPPVRCGHDENGPASLVRRIRCCGRSGPFAGLGHSLLVSTAA